MNIHSNFEPMKVPSAFEFEFACNIQSFILFGKPFMHGCQQIEIDDQSIKRLEIFGNLV
jgi:hypothetical protein